MITEQKFLEYAKANDYYVKKKNHNTCKDCKWFKKKDPNDGTRWGFCTFADYQRGARRMGQVACVDYDDGEGED